ncbi:MAG: ABC transporter permease subunit [Alphaproteobacteria bacterium]|nr:ABC transporter permease subunit [Alphaproteobacteria bacterium]
MTQRLLPALAAAAFLALWALGARSMPPALLPSPLEVLGALARPESRLVEATATTAAAAILGLGLAFSAGLSGAVLFLRSRGLELALQPYALLLQTVPIIAIAPLLVIWLGYGLPVAVATAAIVSFFPILTSASVGLKAVDPAQVDLVRLYGATWWQELRLLRLPSSLPYLFAGLRTAVGLSVIGAIVGEFVGSNGQPVTLGFLVLRSARSAQTEVTFAAILASTALALTLFGMVRLVEARVIGPWHAGGER